MLLNGRDATIIIGGATLYVLQRGPTIDSAAAVHHYLLSMRIISFEHPLANHQIMWHHPPLHRFCRFISLSFIAAYPLCNSGAWNVCSSDVGTVLGGGRGSDINLRGWRYMLICCIDKQQSSSDNWMPTSGEAGDGLGTLIGGGGGARLYKNTK